MTSGSLMRDLLPGLFGLDMGIDLGTCNTLVCVRGRGIVLNEPSVVAVKRGTHRVLRNGQAVGVMAQRMLGKTPGSITAVRPMVEGVIADFDITRAMLEYFIRKAHAGRALARPRVVIAVPLGITEVEKQAVFEAAHRAGARRVYLVPESKAAAIGAGLPVAEPRASMVIDIGGGTTEVAILSLADVSVYESLRVAGDDMDEAIMQHLKRTYNLLIGPQTAERIKIEIGSAAELPTELTMEVKGRDTISGLPRKVVIGSEEVREALGEPVGVIIDAVMRTVGRAEPELAADLVREGVCLVGGGALLRGLETLLQQTTGLDFKVADDPLSCVAMGTSIFLEHLDEWSETLESDRDW